MNPICFDDNKEDEVKSAEGFLLTSDTSSMDGIHGDPEVVPRVGDEYQAELPPFTAASHRSWLVKKTRDSEIAVDMPESFSLGLPLPLMWTHCESDIDSFLGLKTRLDQPRDKYLLPELLANRSWTDIEYNSFLLGLYTFGKNLNFLKRFVGTKSMGDILSFYYGKFFKSKGYSRWSECRKLKTRRCIFGQKIFSGWRQQELLSRLFSRVAQDCQTTLVEISRNFGEGKMQFEEYIFALKDAVGIDFLVAAVGIGKGKYDLTGNALEPTKTNHIFSVRQEMPTGKACSSLAPADIIKILTGNFRLSKARSSDLFWEAVWPRLLANGWHSEEPKDNVVSGTKQYLVFLIPGVKKFSRRKLDKGTHYFDSISDVLNKVASDPRLLETEIQATEGSVDRENKENKLNQDGVSNTHQCPSLQSHSSKCKPDLVKFTIVDTSMVHHDMDQRKVRQTRGLPFQPVSITTISSSSSSESETATSEDSEDQIIQANASSPIVDQVEQANSSYHVEDQVEQVNCSYHVEDQVEQVNSSYHVEDQVEQVNSSYHVEDQVEQVNSPYPVEDRVEQANSYDHVEEISDKGVGIDSSDRTCTPETLNTTPETLNTTPETLNTTDVDVENHKFHADLPDGEHLWDMNEPPLSEKMTSDCTNFFPCTTKVKGLQACSHGEFSHSAENTFMDRMFDLNEPILPSNLHEASEGMALSFPSYQAKGSPNMRIEGSAAENQQVGEVSAKNSETRMLIDLNFPQVAPGLAIDLNLEIPFSNAIHQNDDQCTHTLSLLSETIQLNAIQEFPDGNKEQQPIIGNRRQSSRSRPLTAKALEAMEYGFLNSKRKRKNTESSDNNAKSQCLRASNETVIGATCDNSIGNSLADTSAKEENVIREYSFIV